MTVQSSSSTSNAVGRPTSYQAVETPQALLSRNPASLQLVDSQTEGNTRPLTVSQVADLRKDVAQALLDHSITGKWQRRILNELQDDPCENDSENDTDIDNRQDQPHSKRRKVANHQEGSGASLFPGTIALSALVALESIRKQQFTLQSDIEGGPVYLSTGLSPLDEMISLPNEYTLGASAASHSNFPSTGGIPFGYVTQFIGPSGCGKTQLTLGLALTAARNLQLSCWFLTSSMSTLSLADRLWQLSQDSGSSMANFENQDASSILKRIQIIPVRDECQVLAQLARIELDLEAQSGNGPRQSGVLILDSASGCLSTESEDCLRRVARTLRRLARQYALAVVITNGTVSSAPFSSEIGTGTDSVTTRNVVKSSGPALGRAWNKDGPSDVDVRLEALPTLSTPQVTIYKATLERHFAKECVNSLSACTYSIQESGVQLVC